MTPRITVTVFVILAIPLVMAWVLFAAIRPGTSQSAALFPIFSHGKYGYINQTGKVVIAPRFERAKRFSEGLARVKVGGKWGFIDVTGKSLIQPQFELVNENRENDSSLDFHEGMAAVSLDGKKWGFIDKSGRMSIAPNYVGVSRFSDGIAQVSSPRYPPVIREMPPKRPPTPLYRSWYIDKSGKILGFPIVGETFSNGLAVAMMGNEENHKEGYIDRTGQIIQPQFRTARSFREGLACVQPLDMMNYWGYIDTTGKMVIPPRYLDNQAGPGDFSEGLAAMKSPDEDKWGFIDKTGTFVIEPKFIVVGRFSDGVAGICAENERANADEEGPDCGFIDRTGKWVISTPTLTMILTDFYEGLAMICGENYCGYINKKGDHVWRTTERFDPEALNVCSWNLDYLDEYKNNCQD